MRRRPLGSSLRVAGAILSIVVPTLAAAVARAETPAPKLARTEPTPDPSPADAPSAPKGVAVIAVGEAGEEAFALAKAVYASRLRPPSLTEAQARILAGAPVPERAPAELAELAELRGAISGEDVASRRLLASVAAQLHVRALLVVATASSARLFLAEGADLDAARYEPEPGVGGALAWRATVASLERRLLPSTPNAASPAATHAVAPSATGRAEPRPFYTSPWLWGALGAAALAGGAIFIASRDASPDSMHLRMRVTP